MDLAALAAEIRDDPLERGYTAHLPDDPGIVADLLNAVTGARVVPRVVTIANLLGLGPLAAAALDSLEAASLSDQVDASQRSMFKWTLRALQTTGVDVGHPTTREYLLALRGTVFTTDAADALLAMAIVPCTRAQELGLPAVSAGDVIDAMKEPTP